MVCTSVRHRPAPPTLTTTSCGPPTSGSPTSSLLAGGVTITIRLPSNAALFARCKRAAGNCSNKCAVWRFGCTYSRLVRRERRSTRPAPPLCKQGVRGSSPLGSTPSQVHFRHFTAISLGSLAVANCSSWHVSYRAQVWCRSAWRSLRADLVVHEREALIVEPGDITGLSTALERLSADGELRARVGEAARHRAQGFPTWDDSARSLFAAVRRLQSGTVT
jgi:hypothetical protein